MHGRIKVRTSEEEKIRKEKERQEKLKIFKHAMYKIQEKRKLGELDNELLEITSKVLSSNPDIYTLWNIRRETFQILRNNIDNPEEITKIHDDELQLTEYCLKVNPKSYCAWHQREWILTTRPDPDWKKELDICDKYLQFDERNFHTWDYRRFVVAQCKPPLKAEFDFTTEKLYDNFSNYSAWHYRSKMLLHLYPDLEGGRPIEDSHHKHELKMVQSAAFTDPDDTSAWFYQRWLLGAVKTVIQAVVCTVTKTKTTVAFNKHVTKSYLLDTIVLLVDDVPVNGDWESSTGLADDILWILKHDKAIVNNMDIKLVSEDDSSVKHQISCTERKPSVYVGTADADFRKKYSEPVIDELNNQLTSCRQLLELEPDSKWTALTTTFFLHCINPKKHHNEIISNLYKLKELDKLRAGYYDDLISKWCIEDQISDRKDEGFVFKNLSKDRISILPHLQYYSYCEEVDLSNQNLTSKSLPSLVVLQHCKILNLENNRITSLKNFPKLELDQLLLKGNSLDMAQIVNLQKINNFKILY